MSSPKLKVLVVGHVNDGKSTVAHLVGEKLLQMGFDVELVDEPQQAGWMNMLPSRIQSLRGRDLKITVQTMQERRWVDGPMREVPGSEVLHVPEDKAEGQASGEVAKHATRSGADPQLEPVDPSKAG